MGKFVDMTGWKMWEHGVPNSKLIVIKRIENYKRKGAYWICRCNCGNSKDIIVSTHDLNIGHTISCGCLKKERCKKMAKTAGLKHGDSYVRLYSIWSGMKNRCYNPTNIKYKNYGGRGIKICEEWKNDYISFKNWAINNGYAENLTIERKDVNGDYCPENCYWATLEEQANNTTRNRIITYKNETLTVTQWSRKLNIPVSKIRSRLKANWPIEKIFESEEYYEED